MEEKKLSGYIDDLNKGKTPKEHKNRTDNAEYQKLLETVRKVRSLREVEYPDDLFQKRLADTVMGTEPIKKNRNRILKRSMFFMTAAAAAAVLLFITINQVLPSKGTNIVYAMEKAMKEVKAYHGIIEVSETNELGETMTQSKREVWADKNGNYYIIELEGTSAGLITANNGEKKWQIRPEEETAYIFTVFPDAYRFTFELGNEINDITNALTVKIIGPETVGGRDTTKLEITPDGGDAYYLWVDNETDLPLQRQSAMQNAIQVKVAFSSIEFMDEIPQNLQVYSLPSGYNEVNTNSEQIITTLEEAADLIGFIPKLPEEVPVGYTLDKMAVEKDMSVVKLYYTTGDQAKTILITQIQATGELIPAAAAILGTVNENLAEIITTDPTLSIRWQEQDMEYKVIGEVAVEELSAFAEGISVGEVVIPKAAGETIKEPQVKVDVDITAEENEQKSVDAGHSPWKLDPVFVAQVYASLLLSPEGIVGDYPISYDNITIISNNGTDAVAEIKDDKTIAKYVYMKRLIRQDDSGIWTVVGYDPAK